MEIEVRYNKRVGYPRIICSKLKLNYRRKLEDPIRTKGSPKIKVGDTFCEKRYKLIDKPSYFIVLGTPETIELDEDDLYVMHRHYRDLPIFLEEMTIHKIAHFFQWYEPTKITKDSGYFYPRSEFFHKKNVILKKINYEIFKNPNPYLFKRQVMSF